MKYVFVSLGSALLGLGIGISATRVFEIYHARQPTVPPVYDLSSTAPVLEEITQPRKYVVVVIASNSEFYIGKERVPSLKFRTG